MQDPYVQVWIGCLYHLHLDVSFPSLALLLPLLINLPVGLLWVSLLLLWSHASSITEWFLSIKEYYLSIIFIPQSHYTSISSTVPCDVGTDDEILQVQWIWKMCKCSFPVLWLESSADIIHYFLILNNFLLLDNTTRNCKWKMWMTSQRHFYKKEKHCTKMFCMILNSVQKFAHISLTPT